MKANFLNSWATVNMKSTAFWEVTPRVAIEVLRRFGGTYCLHLQGQREAKNLPKRSIKAGYC
jgi:hypothetical protein